MTLGPNIEDTGLPSEAPDRESVFHDLVEGHRADLHAHCYRMLGSLHDADDALQDTLLRAWRSLPRFRGESSMRTWLHRIATNVCLDAIAKRPKRVLPIDYGPPTAGEDHGRSPLPGSRWIEPFPDEVVGVTDGKTAPDARLERREALELAFAAALQHLPPRQRATLILRDVLGFSAKETAESLGVTVPAANGALRRARATVAERVPEQTQQATLRELGDRKLREIVERFADSFERGDIDAILAMLTDDASFAMPPFREWCRGRDEIAKSWLMPEGPAPRLRYVAARANGQLALGAYAIRPDGTYEPIALDVLTLRGDLIADMTVFRDTSSFPRFELPERLSDAPTGPRRGDTG
ncbi:MAG TPA: RNA polymerase subunit sigma-70 [Solirubrobacterales bacterium]|nr:RNA polymerase subunit sigma-70 [Solirubrobacterales bacterium]